MLRKLQKVFNPIVVIKLRGQVIPSIFEIKKVYCFVLENVNCVL